LVLLSISCNYFVFLAPIVMISYHIQYVAAAANLRATNFGIVEGATFDDDAIRKMVAGVEVPSFTPKEGVKIQTPEEAEAEAKAKEAAGGGGGGAAAGGETQLHC